MNRYQKWLAAAGALAAAGLFAAAGLVIYVDPFFQFHKPLSWFPYLVDNQVSQNPGLARHMEYDSILLGSSMTTAFNTDWFEQEMGLHTQKLSYNGAYPRDHHDIMEIVFDAKKDSVKAVFLGLDEGTASADVMQTKFPEVPYLQNETCLDNIPYLWNKEVILDYILRPMADTKDKSDWAEIYKPWWTDEYYNKASVLMYYEPAPKKEEPLPEDSFLEAVEENLAVNICPFIEEHPETEFYIFYPPYSILYWNDVTRQKELDAVIRKLEYMTERLLAYDNVRVFSFQNNRDIVTNLNNYADYTHYHKDICHYMVRCFQSGEWELTPENYKEQLADLKKMAAEYDYEAIYDNWYDQTPRFTGLEEE